MVGAIFGIKALDDKNTFEDGPTTSRADDVERNSLIADMALGVTLTLGITGLVLLLSDNPPADTASAPQNRLRREKAGLRLAPFVSPRAAGAAATLEF